MPFSSFSITVQTPASPAGVIVIVCEWSVPTVPLPAGATATAMRNAVERSSVNAPLTALAVYPVEANAVTSA
ncbi:MAG TPA: hypothetical protein VIC62_11335, partial [Nakamurella sp.]